MGFCSEEQVLEGRFLEGLLQGAQSEGFVVKSQSWKRPFLEGLLQLRLCFFKEPFLVKS